MEIQNGKTHGKGVRAVAAAATLFCLAAASCCPQRTRQFRFVGESPVLTTLAAGEGEPFEAPPLQSHGLETLKATSVGAPLGLATCKTTPPTGFVSNQASAVAIGPRAVLTAAHVLDSGSFQIDGIGGDCEAAPGWEKREDTKDDLALCRMRQRLWRKKVAALDLTTKVKAKAPMLLVGNGGKDASCDRDGTCARAGSVDSVSSGLAFVTGCFCPGDSGGPVFIDDKVVGVMVKGCRGGGDSTVVLTRPHAGWIRDWAKKKGNEICGFNSSSQKCPAS